MAPLLDLFGYGQILKRLDAIDYRLTQIERTQTQMLALLLVPASGLSPEDRARLEQAIGALEALAAER